MKNFYITTTLPYVNAEAHIGHALEFVRADAVARAKTLQGYGVFFNTGTDEHGQKVFAAAEKAGMSTKEYVDMYAAKFKELLPILGISDAVHFIRTTDPHHELAAQEFWKRVNANGYIYKKNYKAKYCVGCELEKTDSELVDGKCIIHPQLVIEMIEEENYFFKFSEFGDKLLNLYDTKKHSIIPEFRMNEMREFIKHGLNDFSISRLKSKMKWGIEVPGDSEHVMYVWFDALVNYLSALGWPETTEQFEKFWLNGTPTQYCGKDNTRFQSVMWQAMLLAADLPPTHTVVVDGFVTGDGGIKMSKSLGNVVSPIDIVKEYGTDALRYFLLREISAFEDSPFTIERFKEAYNANLANGIGNLTSRIMKMAEDNLDAPVEIPEHTITDEYFGFIDKFELNKAMDYVWAKIAELDGIIQSTEPYKLVKVDKEKGVEIIKDLAVRLYTIGRLLNPMMPDASAKIKTAVKTNKMPSEPLFLRK